MIVDNPSQCLSAQPNAKPIGSMRINYIIYFYLTIILFTPAYTYHMAVKNKQEPPFPHATVTNTACHYPQAQIFRWTMTSAGAFLTLIFHVVFRYFEKSAKKYDYPGHTYAYMYWPTILSVLGYLAAIGTIDIGGTGNLHSIGAVYFFICLYFLVVNLTIISRTMRRWDTKFMSAWSLVQKIVVAGYLSIIWIYCLVGLVSEQIHPSNDDDVYVVIVEWNLVYAGLIWVLCFLGDFKHVRIVFTNNKAPEAVQQTQTHHISMEQYE